MSPNIFDESREPVLNSAPLSLYVNFTLGDEIEPKPSISSHLWSCCLRLQRSKTIECITMTKLAVSAANGFLVICGYFVNRGPCSPGAIIDFSRAVWEKIAQIDIDR